MGPTAGGDEEWPDFEDEKGDDETYGIVFTFAA